MEETKDKNTEEKRNIGKRLCAWMKEDTVWKAAIGIIWLAGIFLRLYRLTEIPNGMHVDEAGMAYDAWCLGNFGTDRFLNSWPVYLINYGSGQSAMYAYLCMLFLKIGGVNLWMIRMPAFLLGCAVMVFGTLIAWKCFAAHSDDRWAAVLTALLLAVCPYFMMASRMGFDCNLMLGFSTITMYALICAAESGKRQHFVLTGILLGLTLYTYSLSWMVAPIFLVFAVPYLMGQKRLQLKNLVGMGFPTFLLALPLLLFVVVNDSGADSLHILWFTIPKLPYFRTDHFQWENIADNILILKTLLTKDQYSFNAVEPYGTLYRFTVPFVLLGIVLGVVRLVQSIRKRSMDAGSLVFLWFLAQMVCALITKDPDIYRMNGIYFSLVFLAVLSMKTILDLLGRLFQKLVPGQEKAGRFAVCAGGGMLVLCYLVQGISFANYYFTQYSEDYPIHWYINAYVDEVMEIFRDADPEQEIYFDNYNCTLYAYDCLIRRVSPYDYNQENDMFTSEENLGHRHYYLPPAEEIRDDAWYVVLDYSGYGGNLEARGFQCNEYGYYKVYYK
ncbi:MAG: glycosyltransferase family 39 protein [Lachnospiraceae bacterium]|nr:glycosyltransferase family 39 protein [Lachnospiraceae bacterium]